MKRSKAWMLTPEGKNVTCTNCSWWTRVEEEDVRSADQAFQNHVCEEHPPLKNLEKLAGPE